MPPDRKVVDLESIRRGLARLDELAKDPTLTTPEAQARCAEWTEKELPKMARKPTGDETKSDQIFVRCEPTLTARLDLHTKTLQGELPGHRLTRADTIRSLLIESLDRHKVPQNPAPKGPQ